MEPIYSKKNTTKIVGFETTEADYRYNVESYTGFCLGCGEARDCCEGDARNYPCDDGCGENKVYGTEELLIMGRIRLTE